MQQLPSPLRQKKIQSTKNIDTCLIIEDSCFGWLDAVSKEKFYIYTKKCELLTENISENMILKLEPIQFENNFSKETSFGFTFFSYFLFFF